MFQFGCNEEIEDKTFVDLNSDPHDKGEFSWAFKAFAKSNLYFCNMQKFLWADSLSRRNLNSMLAGLLEGKLATSLANCTKFSGQKFCIVYFSRKDLSRMEQVVFVSQAANFLMIFQLDGLLLVQLEA